MASSPSATLPSNAREALLAARTADGHWEGCLSSSALSTATAVTALALADRHRCGQPGDSTLVRRGLTWLLEHQNDDGGWGDTDRSLSNISTTALGWAALAFAPRSGAVSLAEQRASQWLCAAAGGGDPRTLIAAIVARYGKDRTFSVPILTMCALAGRLGPEAAAWRRIPQLPFELSVIPRRFFTVVTLPVVSYALPALIAMGLVRHRRRPTRNPVTRVMRTLATDRSLEVLRSLQPPNGGFLEAAPLTSFVAMSLIGAGHGDHPVATLALDFLRGNVRSDGSWPIDTNLATWLTTMAIQALDAGNGLGNHLDADARRALRQWLLQQQTRAEHAYTGAAPGAWSWTPLPGGVPDADDTAGALLALHALGVDDETQSAAARGITWLLDLQNRDGGVPTFCRGWGTLPFDRSGADLTAHAVRAWLAWAPHVEAPLRPRIDGAVKAALSYLSCEQRADGAFVPLWFGNHHAPGDENATYGTSRVLLALSAAGATAMASRARAWLLGAQNPDGGWGGDRSVPSSIEETALALSALAAADDPAPIAAMQRGTQWLLGATAGSTRFPASPIGFYFAKLWYYERLYPIIWTTEAIARVGDRCEQT